MPGKGWVRSLFQRPEMLDHLRKEFERADTSGVLAQFLTAANGRLEVGELHKALMVIVWQLKQAGMFHESMTVTYEQTMHIFQTYDKNGDGTVDFIEFKDIAADLLTRPFQNEKAVKAFCKSVMDRMLAPEEGEAESKISRMFKDIGGALDQHALTEIMRELHRGFQGQGFINPNSVFDKSWVTYILSKHDTDGSGVIEEDEFVPIMEDFLHRTFFIPR